jgi:DNA-directed RNA polymerase specialized sigma24 family protein
VNEQAAGGSVTIWLNRLKLGDRAAAQALWDGYFRRLVALARARLRAAPRSAADEEDVALSAFDSFYRAAAAGRFPRLDDRDDLWKVLFVLTTRKAIALVHHETCEKRGGTRAEAPDPVPDAVLVAAAGPTPDEAVEVAENCRRLLDGLGADLRIVAVWKMEGYTNAEIAAKIGRVEGTVERKLDAIRRIWRRRGLAQAPRAECS